MHEICGKIKKFPKSTEIPEKGFSGIEVLTGIIIPGRVTKMHRNAFSGCSNLAQITISSNVVSIGNYVFVCCNNLKEITIPNSVTKIGAEVFASCSSLTKIDIPDFLYEKLEINTVIGRRTLGLDSDSNTKILFDGKELNSLAEDSILDEVSNVSVPKEPKPLQANEPQKNMDEH